MWGLLLVPCNSVRSAAGRVLGEYICWVVGDMPDTRWKEKQYPQRRTSSGTATLQLVLGWTKAGRKPEPNLLQRRQVDGTATQLCHPAFPAAVLLSDVLNSKSLGLISIAEAGFLVLRRACTSLFVYFLSRCTCQRFRYGGHLLRTCLLECEDNACQMI